MADNATTEQGLDVFDDSVADEGAANDSQVTDNAGAGDDAVKAVKANDDADGDAGQTGEKDAAAPPTEVQEGDPEFVTDAKGQKMIPEHRFKAALKAVTEERDNLKAENAKYTAVPVPDKETDPEGYDLHTRMEASKAVMMEMRTDYQEKIDHFAMMAKDNPLLNQAVAANPIPAKLAYDIAAKDLEIKDALAVKGSDEWKEFQEFKKSKAAAVTTTPDDKLNNTLKRGLQSVPNLNRSTNASPNRNVRKVSNGDNDDDLWAGAKF